MDELQGLLQKQADLRAEGQTLRAKGGKRTPEEDARYDAVIAEMEALAPKIERERKFNDQARLLPSEPDANQVAAAAAIAGGVTATAKETFGYRNLADFAGDVMKACAPGGTRSERLHKLWAAPTNFMQETGAASGEGYAVPPAFRNEIWELAVAMSDILGLMTPEPTSSNAVELLADESTPWGTAGIQATWRAEGAQLTASKLATKLRQVRLHELYAFVIATGELLRDAPRLNDRLTRGAARAISWKISEALMNGDGAGQPLGWMNSPAVVKVNRAVANQIATGDVLALESRLLQTDGSKQVYFAHRSTIPQLGVLTIGNMPVFVPPGVGMQQSLGGYLMGKPLIWSEHAAALGTVGDLQLVDLSGYYMTQQEGGTDFATSIHLFFDYNMQAFRWIIRAGGEPFLSAAVVAAKGATRSHFVALN